MFQITDGFAVRRAPRSRFLPAHLRSAKLCFALLCLPLLLSCVGCNGQFAAPKKKFSVGLGGSRMLIEDATQGDWLLEGLKWKKADGGGGEIAKMQVSQDVVGPRDASARQAAAIGDAWSKVNDSYGRIIDSLSGALAVAMPYLKPSQIAEVATQFGTLRTGTTPVNVAQPPPAVVPAPSAPASSPVAPAAPPALPAGVIELTPSN